MYTLIFSRRARHVYAFEPFPRNIRYLSRMLSLNRVRNATIVPWAVADTLGLASFAEGPDCATGKISPGAGQPVVTVSLDQFVSVYGAVPSVIKIDVEGSELDVLNGARELLRARRPAILLSTHGPGLKEKCLALLKDLGYSRFTPLDGPGTPPGHEVDFAIMP